MDEHGRYFQDHSRLVRFFSLVRLWQAEEPSDSTYLKWTVKLRLGSLEKATHQ